MSVPHVFVATPAYSGKVHVQYAISLMETRALLAANNVVMTNKITTSGSLLVAERNRLVEAFWQSGATHMLCIDSDLGWPAQAVVAMLQADKPFIAGLYPARGEKNSFIFRPFTNPDGSLYHEGHLFKMQYIPAGFMLIKREVIGALREKFPELYYEPKDPNSKSEKAYCFFNTEVWESEFWGEDYVFCRKVREAGFDIWVDPLIQFDHDGTIGGFHEVLSQETPENELKDKPKDSKDVVDVEAVFTEPGIAKAA